MVADLIGVPAAVWVLLVISAVLLFAVLRHGRDLRHVRAALHDHMRQDHSVLTESVASEHHHDHEASEWPAEGPLQVGQQVDGRLLSLELGRWHVLLLVRPSCTQCRTVLNGLPHLLPSLSDYVVWIVSIGPSEDLTFPPGARATTVDIAEGNAPPVPAIALVDPAGVVQGRGNAETATDLVAFVTEGRQHGYGPPLPV